MIDYDVIIGFRRHADAARHASQYDLKVKSILNLVLGIDIKDVRRQTKLRTIYSTQPEYHAMRLLFADSDGCYYKFTYDEFQLILLPFSEDIVCHIHKLKIQQLIDLSNEIKTQDFVDV